MFMSMQLIQYFVGPLENIASIYVLETLKIRNKKREKKRNQKKVSEQ